MTTYIIIHTYMTISIDNKDTHSTHHTTQHFIDIVLIYTYCCDTVEYIRMCTCDTCEYTQYEDDYVLFEFF